MQLVTGLIATRVQSLVVARQCDQTPDSDLGSPMCLSETSDLPCSPRVEDKPKEKNQFPTNIFSEKQECTRLFDQPETCNFLLRQHVDWEHTAFS